MNGVKDFIDFPGLMIFEKRSKGDAYLRFLLIIVLAVQFFCWTVSPLLTNDAPPLDVIENTVWGTEGVVATYKNPALSSLLLEAARLATGGIGWPAYFLSQIAVCLTIWFVFLLGHPVLGSGRALVGSLLLTACYYFGWHTPEFNQDILEMPFWAGVSLALWRAVDTNRVLWWAALGAFAAGALYGKLSALVLLGAAAIWLAVDTLARKRLASAAPWIGLATFLILFLPLARWLADGGLEIIAQYAVHRGAHALRPIPFALAQLGIILPMVLVAAASGLFAKTSSAEASAWFPEWQNPEFRRFVRYLTWMAFGPILLTLVAVIAERTGAKPMWGVPMLNLVGLLISASVPAAAIDDRLIKRVFYISLAIIILTSTGAALTTRFAAQFTTRPQRQSWPKDAIAIGMREVWEKEVGRPLRIIAGDENNWAAGLVALSNEGIAHVFTLADYWRSPWITPEQVKRDGALVVWDATYGEPRELAAFLNGRTTNYKKFPLRHPGRAREVTLGYGIVPPANN